MDYASKKPYPTVKVEKSNISYAKLLLENYAGKISEDTAVHLYMYQHIIMNDIEQEFADIMRRIGIVEMKHLSLLGETIKLLGLKPIYATIETKNYINPWNSTNVDYAINLKDMLEVNIKSEETAIRNYRINMSLIEDKYIKELLARIIEDEEIHLKIFKELREKMV